MAGNIAELQVSWRQFIALLLFWNAVSLLRLAFGHAGKKAFEILPVPAGGLTAKVVQRPHGRHLLRRRSGQELVSRIPLLLGQCGNAPLEGFWKFNSQVAHALGVGLNRQCDPRVDVQ